jgi:hypothetical protein
MLGHRCVRLVVGFSGLHPTIRIPRTSPALNPLLISAALGALSINSCSLLRIKLSSPALASE